MHKKFHGALTICFKEHKQQTGAGDAIIIPDAVCDKIFRSMENFCHEI